MSDLDLSDWLLVFVLLTSTGSLLLGFMTPVVAFVIGLGSVAANYNMVVMIGLTAAIGLLGPGAFSVDARMFGRREVFIPKRANEMFVATDRPDHSLPTHATDRKPGAGV